MRCRECYSENPRITPLKGAEDCLKHHRQYVCSTCGRIICIDLAGEKRARCLMPFGSPDIALLYLKPAEIITGGVCGIYELIYRRGDKRYRIFRNRNELQAFLKGHTEITCQSDRPVYLSEQYVPVKEEQIRYLYGEEVGRYLEERLQRGIR